MDQYSSDEDHGVHQLDDDVDDDIGDEDIDEEDDDDDDDEDEDEDEEMEDLPGRRVAAEDDEDDEDNGIPFHGEVRDVEHDHDHGLHVEDDDNDSLPDLRSDNDDEEDDDLNGEDEDDEDDDEGDEDDDEEDHPDGPPDDSLVSIEVPQVLCEVDAVVDGSDDDEHHGEEDDEYDPLNDSAVTSSMDNDEEIVEGNDDENEEEEEHLIESHPDRNDEEVSQNDYEQNMLMDATYPEFIDVDGDDGEMGDEMEMEGDRNSPDADGIWRKIYIFKEFNLNLNLDGQDEDMVSEGNENDIWGPGILRMGQISGRRSSIHGPSPGSLVRRSSRIRQSDNFEAFEMAGSGLGGPHDARTFQVRIDGEHMPNMMDIMDAVRGASGSSGSMHMHIPPSSIFGSSGGSFGTFQQFVSSIMPSSIPMHPSAARIDPRTGSLTLSLGGSHESSSMDATEHIHAHARSTGNSPTGGSSASSTTPPMHPLVMIASDARPGRYLAHTGAGSSGSVYASRAVGSNMIATLVTNMRDPIGFHMYDSRRPMRSGMHTAPSIPSTIIRRKVGPIVSDRRWGTDVGEIEPVGSRLNTLYIAVENSMAPFIQQPPSTEASKKIENSKKMGDFIALSRSGRFDMLPDFTSDGSSSDDEQNMIEEEIGAESHESDEETADNYNRSEESKEEGVLQESKDGDDHPSPAAHAPSTSSGTLPETIVADGGDNSTAIASSEPPKATSSSSNDAAFESIDHSLNNIGITGQDDTAATEEFVFREPITIDVTDATPHIAVEATNDSTAQAADTLQAQSLLGEQKCSNVDSNPLDHPQLTSSSSSASSSDLTTSQQTSIPTLSEENLIFINSLSLDLRHEVLITSTDDFLSTLPPMLQEEVI